MRALRYSSLFSVQNLDEVIAEWALNRPQDLSLFSLEGSFLELRDHFALAKPS